MVISRRMVSWLSVVLVAGGYAMLLVMTVSMNYGFDAMVHVKQSLMYSQDWAFFTADHYDQSPPLRYVPYTFLINVFQPESYESTFRLATLYASMATFVGGGIASYELGRTWDKKHAHWLGVIACLTFFVTALVWPTNRFLAGKWQYTTTFPLMIISLLTAGQTIRVDRPRQLRWSVATGVILGILGLQQLIYAGIASLAVGITLLVYRYYRAFSLVGVTGAAFASLLLVGQNEASQRVALSFTKRFMPESGPLTLNLDPLLFPGVLAIIIILTIVSVLWWITNDRGYVTTIVYAVVYVSAIIWTVTKMTTAQEYLTVSVLHPMVFFAGVVILSHLYMAYQATS